MNMLKKGLYSLIFLFVNGSVMAISPGLHKNIYDLIYKHKAAAIQIVAQKKTLL